MPGSSYEWTDQIYSCRGRYVEQTCTVVEQTVVQAAVADACSFVDAGSDIRCAEPGGVSGVVGLLLLRLALRSHPRPVVLDLAICRGGVPSQDGSDQTGHRRGRGEAAVPGLDRSECDASGCRQGA